MDPAREKAVQSLAAVLDEADGYTHDHSDQVAALAAATAHCLGLEDVDVRRIWVGALLHDIGKIRLPTSILTKQGPLTPDEWHCIRDHPALGRQILSRFPQVSDAIPFVLHHQERCDGTGYPYRLRGEQIPLGARIIAVADAYHAMTSDRPYRDRRSHAEAASELQQCCDVQFDSRIVQHLLVVLDRDHDLYQHHACGNFALTHT